MKVNDFRVHVEGTEIEFQSEIDVLDVRIDDDINFNCHVSNVCRTAFLSGSLHLDLVLVNWKKSRKGPCDLY